MIKKADYNFGLLHIVTELKAWNSEYNENENKKRYLKNSKFEGNFVV